MLPKIVLEFLKHLSEFLKYLSKNSDKLYSISNYLPYEDAIKFICENKNLNYSNVDCIDNNSISINNIEYCSSNDENKMQVKKLKKKKLNNNI